MVDIAMCNRRDCGKKNNCYRYLAYPSEYQSYIIVEKQELEDGCDMYWRCRDKKELAIMNKLNHADDLEYEEDLEWDC